MILCDPSTVNRHFKNAISVSFPAVIIRHVQVYCLASFVFCISAKFTQGLCLQSEIEQIQFKKLSSFRTKDGNPEFRVSKTLPQT